MSRLMSALSAPSVEAEVRKRERDYYNTSAAGLDVPPAIAMALCQLEMSLIYGYDLPPDDIGDHLVSVVAHHGDCMSKPTERELKKGYLADSRAEVRGIVWIWCANRIRAVGGNLDLERLESLQAPKSIWMYPVSWLATKIAARLDLLHPERYRRHVAKTASRSMSKDGFAYELRRCGQTFDMLIKAVVCVMRGNVAIIRAHRRDYEDVLVKRTHAWCDRLGVPDPSIVPGREEQSRVVILGSTGERPRGLDIRGYGQLTPQQAEVDRIQRNVVIFQDHHYNATL